MEKTLAIDVNQIYEKMLETLCENLIKFVMLWHKYGCYLDKRHAQGDASGPDQRKLEIWVLRLFFYKHEGKFTVSIMLGFLRISSWNYAWYAWYIIFDKIWKIKIYRWKSQVFVYPLENIVKCV